MSAYDPSDLMALCEAILEDGELSGREVYRLSQWLNENRDACSHWPGHLLVEPLKSAWSDGQITTAELQEIGRLLVRIHKEWILQADTDSEPPPALGPEVLQKIDLTRPVLPVVPWTTRVKARTDRAESFAVDLSEPACTCADWQQHRSKLPRGHLSRCCRHVLYAYSRIHPAKGWPGWLQAFLAHQWTPHPRKEWMVFSVGPASVVGQAPPVTVSRAPPADQQAMAPAGLMTAGGGCPTTSTLVLASTAPIDWADVFAPEDGEYERFGYHIVEDRWAYGSEPVHADYIRARIINATRAATNESRIVQRVRLRLPLSRP